MPFLELSPRKRRRSSLDYLLIIGAVVLSLVAFQFAGDEVNGKARVSDAFGFTILFAVTGCVLVWLPSLWGPSKRSRLTSFATPVFITLVLSYLYLGFRAYFIQPGGTGIVLMVQLLVLSLLSWRMV